MGKNRFNKTAILPLLLAFLLTGRLAMSQQIWNPSYAVATVDGKYDFTFIQTPSQLVELYPPAIPNTGLTYQWYSSTAPTVGFAAIAGATAANYTPPVNTFSSVSTYYYRVTYSATQLPLNGVLTSSVTSNIIKLAVVSIHWEDVNYIREHDVLNIFNFSWPAVDQLPIGSKLQTTTYLDGLGRPVQKISKQTATPATVGGAWGDVVAFHAYDALGREPVKYLPYTTTTSVGTYKTTALTDEAAYYANTATYNETSAFATTTYDNSPLNRVTNVKEPGSVWAASAGTGVNYDMNTTTDLVEIFTTDYVQGDAPVSKGYYAANTLYKLTSTDVNNNQVVEFTDKAGRLILKKVQSTASQAAGYTGWISTYSVYDDFGLLRFQIQPNGVQYLASNSWSFAGTSGAVVLAEQVFQYNYDDKGRTVWKKAPGAAGLNMIYDVRDRVVFMQDGNQAALSTPQWTANVYDLLDRPVLSALFNTTETIATLKSDVSGASVTSSISVTNTANTGGGTVSANVSLCPTSINNTSLNSATATSVLKYLFYDNYTFPNASPFNTSFNNGNAYSDSDPNVIPIGQTARTLSMPTGDLVRVLGSNIFLHSTSFYDEEGHYIQKRRNNIESGTDNITLQYRFDGRILSSCNSHTNPSAGYGTPFLSLNKYNYDNIGRVVSIQNTLGTNAIKTISGYDYDDMGRLQTKHLDPNYNNQLSGQPDLESLAYSYNIHSQVTGINKDYATKNPANYNKWGHFFGMYLGYDNRDNVFTAAQLDGQVTGQLWNTQGDDAQRKYNYTYDNANRLINAAYQETQTANTGWSNAAMDFSVSGHTGQITYDGNGNLLSLLQKGIMPGMTTPIVIDDLTYAYNAYSNKLQSVIDAMPQTTLNGLFGDFKDGANGATPDYVFDNDGNMVIDLNKNNQSLNGGAVGTPGVHYNYLDKPDQIRLVGQGTIEIVYSADGEKLQRLFVPETGGASTITTYINQYVYQETSTTLTTASLPPFSGTNPHLAYINFEEGRIRAMTLYTASDATDYQSEYGTATLPFAPGGGYQFGAYDYFVRDYQQNVRMILTDETKSVMNTCTMETANGRSSYEDPIFGQTGAANEVEATRIATPSAWTGNTSAFVSHLGRLSGHTLGPNSLQKVMAGDQVTALVNYYYAANSASTNPNIVTNLLNNLLALLPGRSAGTLVSESGSTVTNQLSTNPNFIAAVEPSNATSGTPQAYLTILFFDERFNLISSSNGGVQQAQVKSTDVGNASGGSISLIRELAPKNGYAYIYVSNRSDQDVFFDNLEVLTSAGNLIEENHYYPFGLKIAAISSHKLGDAEEGKLSNPYLYNDKEELDENTTLSWYDYGFRDYDPQIGRFPQLDPLKDEYADLTPFQFAGNDPIANVDLDGAEALDVVAQTADKSRTLLSASDGVVGASRALVDAGTDSQHWVTTFDNALIVAKLPAKGIPLSIKAVLTTTIKVTLNAAAVADQLSLARRSPEQSPSLEQMKRITLVIHDKMDPEQPLIEGRYDFGSKKNLQPNVNGGYMWDWKPMAIQEDNSFWLSFMPVPKAFGLLKWPSEIVETAGGEAAAEGGLNLFKFDSREAELATGWKTGDKFLKLTDRGTPKLNWKQNSGFLRREMGQGNPIFDSYRLPDGSLIPKGGFLGAERGLLQSRGWIYNPKRGAWLPPKF